MLFQNEIDLECLPGSVTSGNVVMVIFFYEPHRPFIYNKRVPGSERLFLGLRVHPLHICGSMGRLFQHVFTLPIDLTYDRFSNFRFCFAIVRS